MVLLSGSRKTRVGDGTSARDIKMVASIVTLFQARVFAPDHIDGATCGRVGGDTGCCVRGQQEQPVVGQHRSEPLHWQMMQLQAMA